MNADPCDTGKRLAYLEQKVLALDREIEIRFAAEQRALELRSEEIGRRLEGLNHEAARLTAMQRTYLAREVFDMHEASTHKQIEKLQEFRDNLMGRMTVAAFMLAGCVAAVSAVVATAIAEWLK